jgi:ATP-binding cassette subfamily B protein
MYFDPRLWPFTKGVRGRIAAAVAVGLLAAAVGIGRLALLGWLLGQVWAGTPFAELIVPLVLVAAIMVLRGWLEYWRNMIAHKTAAIVQLHIREMLYNKVVELGPAYFGHERTGSVIAAMIDGVEQLETYFGQYIPQLCIATLTPIGIFAFVAFLDMPVAAVMLAAALITLLGPQIFHKMEGGNARKRSIAFKAFSSEFLDAVQGLGTLKSFGQAKARADLLAVKARELLRSTMWVLATNQIARGLTDAGITIGVAATLAVGAYRLVDGDMTLTALLMILMMGTEAYRPLRDMRSMLHAGMNGRSAAETMLGLLNAEPVVKQAADAAPAEALAPTISFENVGFAYPGSRRRAHEGLNFTVAEGERVGIVGPSGSGKSTVVRLLLRQYDPTSGAVRLGGRDLRDLTFADIRSRLAVVNQDTYLFHGTVADNIRLGKPDATDTEMAEAAKSANAHEFIARLPQGYETVIGERGIRLSGGQRQRIAIARALLRDAPILVLDEALSSVDAENEAVIQDALDRLMQGRTVLIFAHRLSSVIDADRILVLDDGHVAEEGDHKTLLAKGGAYANLMAAQAAEAGRRDPVVRDEGERAVALAPEDATRLAEAEAQREPTNAILRADGMGWAAVFTELLRFAGPWKLQLTTTFALGIARVCAFIGVGAVGALAVGGVKRGEPFELFLIVLAILAPTAGILHWLESWLAHDFAYRMLAEMRIKLFEKLEALAPSYLLRRRTGDLVGMATQDVETVEYFFAHTIAPAFVAVLIPSVVFALLLVEGWPLALALSPFLIWVALSPFLMRKRIDRLASRAREVLGDLNAHAVDTVQGLAEIAAFQDEGRRGREFTDKVREHHKVRLPFFSDMTGQMAMLETATGLGGLAVVATGAHLVTSAQLEPTTLPLLTLLAMASFLPISEIANIGRQLADTLGSTRRLYAVHGEKVDVTDGPGVPAADTTGGVALAMEDVSFRYYGRAASALDGVSFTVPAGSTAALVGPSGAGKSTTAHLFMRFWDPDAGKVTMDGHDLRDFVLDDLRRRIALVAQDTYLFNDTLKANILIAKPEATDEEVEQAVERAALADFVAAQPDGLETPVGERGMQLSGGQRQRVAIARAFLKDAPVLVLDEATSHLDAVSEAAVRGALEDLMADRTTLVIAHRLSTIRNADVIVAMEDGRIAEIGSHEELLAKGGLYAKLVSHQLAGAEKAAE